MAADRKSEEVIKEPSRPRLPSSLEVLAPLLVAASHAGAFYLIWGLADGALHDLASRVRPASASAWIMLTLAAIGLALTFLTSIRLLKWARRQAFDRRLIQAVEQIPLDPAVRARLLSTIARNRESDRYSRNVEATFGPELLPAITAGEWVMARFADGDAVLAVPEQLAAPERLNHLLGDSDAQVQVLRPGPETSPS